MDRFNGRWLAFCAMLILCCASVNAVRATARYKSLSRLKVGLEGVRESSKKAEVRLKALKNREKVLNSRLTEKIVPKIIPSIYLSLLTVRKEIDRVPAGKPKTLRKKLLSLLKGGHGQVLSLVAGTTCSDSAILSASDVRRVLQEFDSKSEVLEAIEKVENANREPSLKTAVLAKEELKKIRFERKALVKKIHKCEADEKMILAEMDVVRENDAPKPDEDSELRNPVPGRVTSGFGARVHPLDHIEKTHQGIDLAAGLGDPVKSAKDGKVVFAGEQRGYGMIVIVQHSDSLATAYAHLSQIDVEVGDEVERGQTVGRVGMTGNSTGPHLHFEVRENGEQVDPQKYLPAIHS